MYYLNASKKTLWLIGCAPVMNYCLSALSAPFLVLVILEYFSCNGCHSVSRRFWKEIRGERRIFWFPHASLPPCSHGIELVHLCPGSRGIELVHLCPGELCLNVSEAPLVVSWDPWTNPAGFQWLLGDDFVLSYGNGLPSFPESSTHILPSSPIGNSLVNVTGILAGCSQTTSLSHQIWVSSGPEQASKLCGQSVGCTHDLNNVWIPGIPFYVCSSLYWFTWATVMKYRRLRGLNNRCLFLHNSGGWKSRR